MPQDQQNIPHRKNAAEWLMWLALYPFACVMRAAARIKGG
jgi:hypothetical protein